MDRKRIFAIVKYVVFLGLGLFLFWVALGDIKWEQIKDSLYTANYFYVFLTICCLLISHLLRALRWQMLLRASGHPVPFKSTFASTLVGYGFNALVPRGGEFARCTALTSSEKVPFASGFGTVITERLSDVFVLLLLFGALFIMEREKIAEVWAELNSAKAGADPNAGMSATAIILYSILALMALSMVAFFIFRKRILATAFGKKLKSFAVTLRDSMLSILRLEQPVLFLLYTIGIWVTYLLMSYFPLMALKETQHLDLYFSFIVLIFGGIGFMLPSPGGTGTYHIAVEVTFRVFRNAGPAGFIYALMAHAWQFVLTLLFGLMAWLWLRSYTARKQAAEAAAK